MSKTVEEHRSQSPTRVACAVITVSDTRTIKTDRGGPLLVDILKEHGHETVRQEIVPDDPPQIRALLEELSQQPDVTAILLTGGTGIGQRDQTFEVVSSLLDKVMPGYGEIFRILSYEDIGPAAMLSRTIGGVLGGKILLTMPGSPAAVRLAAEKLIGPELGHLVHEAAK